jgi:DNA-binding CsgD family transcriptional regulator
MKRTGVIVAIESYMLRKGVVTILNRVTGVTVIREFEAAAPLQKFIQTRNRDLLVLSQSLFDESGHLLFNDGDLQERTILLTQGKLTEAEGGLPSIDSADNKEKIINKIRDLMEAQPHTPDEPYLFNLSPREKTIVRLVSLGYTNKQIAEELFLSAHTVITHRKNIGHKLGIKSVSGLTVYAIVNNIITIEEVNSNPV